MDAAPALRFGRSVRALALLAALCGCLMFAGRAAAGDRLIVGVDDDTTKWLARPNGLVGVSRDLGLGAVRIMVPWRRAQRTPARAQQTYLHRIALRVGLGDRVVLAVYGRAAQAPVTAVQQDAYCEFVRHVLQRIPRLDDVVVWNEANNATFWPSSAGAASYERLLARCWDELHGLRRRINVIDSTAPHQDPVRFLMGMGAAYRDSGRTRPIPDTYGHNVYPETSVEAPTALHDNGSIDEGDYDVLMSVLRLAFGGTGQPLPGERTTTVWYLEDGFETAVPADKAWLYRDRETARALLPALTAASVGELGELDQASQLQAAIELAYCQPGVGAFFNFQLFDDRSLSGWQSGVMWPDGTPKPSYLRLRETIARIHQRAVTCG
jgi:hypothetical protein